MESSPEDVSLLSDIGYSGRVQDSTGYFEIAGVPPGSYWAYAGVFDDENMYVGSVPVEVEEKDISNIIVQVSEGVDLEGRLHVKPEGAFDFSTLNIWLALADHPLMGRNEAKPRANGTFTLQNVTPGTYQLRVSGLRSSYYVQAARHGNGDVLDQGLTVDATTSGSLDIVLSSPGGGINGIVTKEGKPVQATVLLAPDVPRRNRLDLYVTTRSGPDGTFSLSGLSPGDFKLWAFENPNEDPISGPVFVQEYEAGGLSVSVVDGRTESVGLHVTPTVDEE
jgi:hypothetical protein